MKRVCLICGEPVPTGLASREAPTCSDACRLKFIRLLAWRAKAKRP